MSESGHTGSRHYRRWQADWLLLLLLLLSLVVGPAQAALQPNDIVVLTSSSVIQPGGLRSSADHPALEHVAPHPRHIARVLPHQSDKANRYLALPRPFHYIIRNPTPLPRASFITAVQRTVARATPTVVGNPVTLITVAAAAAGPTNLPSTAPTAAVLATAAITNNNNNNNNENNNNSSDSNEKSTSRRTVTHRPSTSIPSPGFFPTPSATPTYDPESEAAHNTIMNPLATSIYNITPKSSGTAWLCLGLGAALCAIGFFGRRILLFIAGSLLIGSLAYAFGIRIGGFLSPSGGYFVFFVLLFAISGGTLFAYKPLIGSVVGGVMYGAATGLWLVTLGETCAGSSQALSGSQLTGARATAAVLLALAGGVTTFFFSRPGMTALTVLTCVYIMALGIDALLPTATGFSTAMQLLWEGQTRGFNGMRPGGYVLLVSWPLVAIAITTLQLLCHRRVDRRKQRQRLWMRLGKRRREQEPNDAVVATPPPPSSPAAATTTPHVGQWAGGGPESPFAPRPSQAPLPWLRHTWRHIMPQHGRPTSPLRRQWSHRELPPPGSALPASISQAPMPMPSIHGWNNRQVVEVEEREFAGTATAAHLAIDIASHRSGRPSISDSNGEWRDANRSPPLRGPSTSGSYSATTVVSDQESAGLSTDDALAARPSSSIDTSPPPSLSFLFASPTTSSSAPSIATSAALTTAHPFTTDDDTVDSASTVDDTAW